MTLRSMKTPQFRTLSAVEKAVENVEWRRAVDRETRMVKKRHSSATNVVKQTFMGKCPQDGLQGDLPHLTGPDPERQ